ncbi:hypothetical protein [Streptomyces sp. NPDC002746]
MTWLFSHAYHPAGGGFRVHGEVMFAKLRRRLPPEAPGPRRPAAASPEPVPAPLLPAAVDGAVLARISCIRTVLVDGGAQLPTASAPAWFAAVPAGEGLMEEMTVYLGGVPARYALTEEGCADIINQIEMLGVLKEVRAAGVKIRCARGGPFTSAAQLRAVFEHIRRSENDTRPDGVSAP